MASALDDYSILPVVLSAFLGGSSILSLHYFCESAVLNMPANLENSAVATGLEKVSFIPIPKKGNAKECSNYCTIALISYASKVMLKILLSQASTVHEPWTSSCSSWI